MRLGTGLALLAALAALAGCNNQTVIRVQTDIPELAALADRYQASNAVPSVLVEYRGDLGADSGGGPAPDLVVGRGLYNPPTFDNFLSLNDLTEKRQVDPNDFYDFTFLRQRGECRLVVLSWDLPAVVTRAAEGSQDFQESIVLPLENLREKGLQYNSAKKGVLRTIGFSPLYSSEFMFLVAQQQGAELGSDGRGYPSWNPDGLGRGLAYLGDWSTRFNGGPAKESAFLKKFAYNPVFQLLAQGQFTYAYSPAADFLRQPKSATEGLKLKWPTWQDRVRVLDDFVAAGVPRRAAHPAEAQAFLRWLMEEGPQTQAIVDNLDGGLYSFGFLQGFSSRRIVTEKAIPRYFPQVRLRVPPDAMLEFPGMQSLHWESFKGEVFAAWLRQQLLAGKPDFRSLAESRRQWLLHRGLNP